MNSRKTNHRSVISKTFSLVILDVNLDFGKCVWDNTTYASRQMFKAIEQVRNTLHLNIPYLSFIKINTTDTKQNKHQNCDVTSCLSSLLSDIIKTIALECWFIVFGVSTRLGFCGLSFLTRPGGRNLDLPWSLKKK